MRASDGRKRGMAVQFEWDPEKAASNQQKHQITFEERRDYEHSTEHNE
jgi:uncharacterized DUF497 family protein